MFRITRDMYHGTVSYERQIARNLLIKQTIKSEVDNLSRGSNSDVNNYTYKYLSFKQNHRDRLFDPKKLTILQLEANLQKNFTDYSNDQIIYQSNRALVNGKSNI